MRHPTAGPLAVAELTTFRLDYEQPALTGWTRRSSWNGWGCPYFERDVADHVMELINTQAIEDGEPTTISFDQATDSYVMYSTFDEEDHARVQGQDIVTANGVLHVYALGTRVWCWHERGVHYDW